MKFNAYEKWDEIIQQAEKSSVESCLKIVFTSPWLDILFSSDILEDLMIYIHFSKSRKGDINISLNGITVSTSIVKSIDANNEVISIKNNNTDDINVFKAFSATLFDAIEQSGSETEAFDMIEKTIDDYKAYFSGKKGKGLTSEEQQGLFGELCYIKDSLDKGDNFVIDYWEGMNKNKHDFVYPDYSNEVKTTKNHTRLDVKISNENQLDNSLVDNLYLTVYRLEKVEAGKSIFDLYQEIKNKLDYRNSNLLQSKLIQAGMNTVKDENYIKFHLIERFDYLIDDDFPKLTKDSLGDRIFQVTYYLNLDGIKETKR